MRSMNHLWPENQLLLRLDCHTFDTHEKKGYKFWVRVCLGLTAAAKTEAQEVSKCSYLSFIPILLVIATEAHAK